MTNVVKHSLVQFTMVGNICLRDVNISNGAKGLYAVLWDLPENWELSYNGLAKRCKDGVNAVKSQMHELLAEGYVVVTQQRGECGRMSTNIWNVMNIPVSEEERTPMKPRKKRSPLNDFPLTVKPLTVKRTQDNIRINNTHTGSACVRACEDPVEQRFIEQAWGNQTWKEIVCMNNGIQTLEELDEKWGKFLMDCAASDKKHADVSDIRNHFNHWLQCAAAKQKNNENRTISRDEQRREEQGERIKGYVDVIRTMQETAGEIQDEGLFD